MRAPPSTPSRSPSTCISRGMPDRYERRTRRTRIVAMVVVLGMVVVIAAVLIAANGQ